MPNYFQVKDPQGNVIFAVNEAGDVPTGGSNLGGGGAHATSHQNGEVDEISVAGLSGLLADAQTPAAHSHPISDVTGLQTALDGKAASAVVTDHVSLADPHTQYQKESEKAAANGYASLDAGAKVPIAQVPTGSSSSTVCIGDDSRLSDSRTPISHVHAAADITSGVIAMARLATGTPDGTKFIRDDGTLQVPPAGEGGLPAGLIVMWHGLIANIPSGWLLCDGANGTPDLRSKFIKGAAAAAEAGGTGGALTHAHADHASHTHQYSEIVNHTHPVTDPGHTHLTQRYPTATGGSSGFTIDTSMSGTLADNTLPTKTATTGITTSNPAGGVATGTTVGPSATLTHDAVNQEPPFFTVLFIMKT